MCTFSFEGYFILFNGFLCFNCATIGVISNFGNKDIIAKVLMNTALSSASGCITTIIVQEVILGIEPGYWLLLSTVNGGLAGCVSRKSILSLPSFILLLFAVLLSIILLLILLH